MSFNGLGTFVVNSAGQPVVVGTVISDTVFNAFTADIATGLSTCITKDGQTTLTANIPFGGFKATGLAVATTLGDALSYGRAANVTTLAATATTTTTLTASGAVNCTSASGYAVTFSGQDINLTTGGIFSSQAVTVEAGGSGGVILNSAATSWSAVSDYRAKKVKGPFTASGAIIDAVPVHLAAYNTSDAYRPMFLAHEVSEGGAAFAVEGEKNAVNDDGDAVLQHLNSTDPLVPILWAELRSLRKRVAALESR